MGAVARNYVKIAEKYAKDVLSGKIDACEFVKQACQRHFDDLAAAKTKGAKFRFDKDAANRFCRFMEQLPHIKGEWARRGELLVLEPWQCFISSVLFGWLRTSDGTRRFREAYIEVPRKSGKSAFGGGVGLYMFASDGEEGSEVFSGATTEKQAWEVFGSARHMASRAEGFSDFFGINVGAKNLSILKHACKFEPVIGKPGDGSSPHCAIVDEYHEHTTPDLYDTMITGMGARSQPLLLVITTAGTNISSPCYDKRDQVKRVLGGKVQNDELFGIIYTIDTTSYPVIVQSLSDGKRRLEEKCTCGHAKTTRTDRSRLEGCAQRAMTNGGRSSTPNRDVQTTQKGLVGTKECARYATSSGYSITTKSTEIDSSQNVRNGQGTTKTSVELLISDGEKTAESIGCTSRELRKNTEYQKKNTQTYETSKKGDVLYAEQKNPGFALTTATDLGKSGDCFAKNVIQRLDFWETLKKDYYEHSDTCGVRCLKLCDENHAFIYPPDEWTDIRSWRKANPNFGVSVGSDFLEARLLEAKQNASRQNIIKCKHLNVWSNARESWMNMHDWEQCEDKSLALDDFVGKKCIVSFDMAESVDVMALGLTFFEESDGKRSYTSFSKFFLPEAQIEDPKNTHYMGWYKDGLLYACGESEIDNEQIQDELIDMHKRFDVVECVYDPWHAHDIVRHLEASGLKPVEYLQRTQYLSPAMKEVTGAVTGGRFRHAPNKMMDWMVSNVVHRPDAKGEIFPRKEKVEFKIDGAVTLIMGVGRAMMAQVKKKVPRISYW